MNQAPKMAKAKEDVTMERLDPARPIISGDQCGYWDGPLKLAFIRKKFPSMQLKHYVHDADAAGVPTRACKDAMLAAGEAYRIAEEGIEANWTSGAIMVPTPEYLKRRILLDGGEKFFGLVALNSDEILASLRMSNAQLCQILSSSGVCPHDGKLTTNRSYATTTAVVIQDWLNVMNVEQVQCLSSFQHFASRKDEFLEMAINWHPEFTLIYNQCAEKAGMTPISDKKGEIPFFFVFRENGCLVRKKAYRCNNGWMAYIKNKPRPIDIDDVVAVVPKALLLGIILREDGYLLLPKTGSSYMDHTGPLAEVLELQQLPMIRTNICWREFARPFVSWIFNEEGAAGLQRVIESAEVEIIN